MFQVTKEIRFCYGHRLLKYEGKCRHLHGHNGRAVITLQAAGLDGLGMVMDFSQIKRVVGGWIDANLDHRMILHRDDPALPHLQAQAPDLTRGRSDLDQIRTPARTLARRSNARTRPLVRPFRSRERRTSA